MKSFWFLVSSYWISYGLFLTLFSQLWSTFGPSEDGVIIEEGFRDSLLRDRLSRYPLMFGVTKAEMLPYISDHDASYGLETEKRREVLKQFVEKFFRFAKKDSPFTHSVRSLFFLLLCLLLFSLLLACKISKSPFFSLLLSSPLLFPCAAIATLTTELSFRIVS